MKKILWLITLVAAVAESGLAQAPASISGLTLRGVNTIDTGVVPAEAAFAIDFLPDGTFNAHFQAGALVFNTLNYQPPVTGSYSYTVTAANLAVVTLNPPLAVSGLPALAFSSESGGSFDNGVPSLTRYTGQFDLSPTGGIGSSRALVNMSVLFTASQGSTASFGFVVGGTRNFREILIRAVGPSLAEFGINNYAANPVYVFNGSYPSGAPGNPAVPGEASGSGGLFKAGAGWSSSAASTATLSAESLRVGAFPLLQGSNDKADIFLLGPGAYSISVTPKDPSGEGVELIEVYEVE